jgi:c(7)-type cytochrome triheme protein
MKNLWAGVAFVAALACVAVVHAVPPGLTLEFINEDAGSVMFSGTTHADAGLRCVHCHLSPFDVSRDAQISRADHRSDQFCFGCHDGNMAFAARGHCAQCHQD